MTLPPNRPLSLAVPNVANYRMRLRSTAEWSRITLQGWLGQIDTTPTQVDVISIRYQPSWNFTTTECAWLS